MNDRELKEVNFPNKKKSPASLQNSHKQTHIMTNAQYYCKYTTL